jgi:hypothetical protein
MKRLLISVLATWFILSIGGCSSSTGVASVEPAFLVDSTAAVQDTPSHEGTETTSIEAVEQIESARYKTFVFKRKGIQKGVMDELRVTLGADGSMKWTTRIRGKQIDLGSKREFTMRFAYERKDGSLLWRSPTPPDGWKSWYFKHLPKHNKWINWVSGPRKNAFPKELFPAVEQMTVFRSCG